MGFDITLLWNFPVGILRLVTVILGCTAIGLLSKGHHTNLDKEVAAFAIVTACCIGSVLVTASHVGGFIAVKKVKKFEFVFAIVCCLLVVIAGVLMYTSVFNGRPSCGPIEKAVSPCQESYALSVAGGSVSVANGFVYAILSYYLIEKL